MRDAWRRAAAIVFALAFLVAGMSVSVLFWAQDRAHFAGVTAGRLEGIPTFHGRGTRLYLTMEDVVAVDDGTRSYVLCGCDDRDLLERVPGLYNEREKAHLADVQAVFGGVKRAAVTASLAMLAALWLDPRRVRRIALIDAAVVAAAGVIGALAFQPAFLLFHRVFFPQGNFLFDPRTDNIVLLYPEGYWLGVTLRVGATFLLIALAVGALASLSIRFRRDQGSGGTVRA